jgi:hypothetical protein
MLISDFLKVIFASAQEKTAADMVDVCRGFVVF